MRNPARLEYEDYRICYAAIDGREIVLAKVQRAGGKTAVKAVIGKAEIEALSGDVHKIEILLEA